MIYFPERKYAGQGQDYHTQSKVQEQAQVEKKG
jgi:hypothetical protein